MRLVRLSSLVFVVLGSPLGGHPRRHGRGATGAVVNGARVALLDGQRGTVASGRSDGQGRARLEARPGAYLLQVESGQLEAGAEAVQLSTEAAAATVTLAPKGVHEEVTITASPGLVQGVDATPSRST